MPQVRLTAVCRAAIEAHAIEAYPDECCGLVVERGGDVHVERVSNVQDLMHARDPENFPRTARIAFTMGPEAGPLLLAAERGELRLLAFYHSHPDHDAYFSEEDKRQATGAWDEPSYPDAGQVVVSIYDRKVRAIKAFAWDASLNDFTDAELVSC